MVVTNKDAKGYTLIEVLVALVVTSIGLLGMASLQVTALKQNQNAYLRSQAMIAASDIMDRMRANAEGVADGNYFGSGDAYDGNNADKSCEGEECNPSEMAAYDLNNWKSYIQEELSSGGGCITRKAETSPGIQRDTVSEAQALCTNSGDADDPVTVYVWWSDARFRNEDQMDDGGDIQVITLSAEI